MASECLFSPFPLLLKKKIGQVFCFIFFSLPGNPAWCAVFWGNHKLTAPYTALQNPNRPVWTIKISLSESSNLFQVSSFPGHRIVVT